MYPTISQVRFVKLLPIVFPQDLTYGYYNLHKKHGDPKKPLDWAIVEATAITEEGHIVPGIYSDSYLGRIYIYE